MLIELHSHTSRHSRCSQIDEVDLVKSAVSRGLQGVVITDHHYLWSSQEILDLRKKCGVNDSFLILSGQEVETDMGHVLVFGADKTISKPVSLSELRKQFKNAALVWAHPFRGGRVPDDKQLLDKNLDAVEIFSTNHTPKENYFGLKCWHRLKLVSISGSDTHNVENACVYPTHFDHPVSSIEDVAVEIKHSRCRPFIKEIPKSGSNIEATEITFGTKGDTETRSRIILKKYSDAGKWKKAVRAASLTKNIFSHGFAQSGDYRVPEIIEIDEQENIIIETSQRGKNLFDVLSNVTVETGTRYISQTAKWLSRLHNLNLKLPETYSLEATISREEKRFESYGKAFIDTNNPLTGKALKLIERVKNAELELLKSGKYPCVAVHGDFHPKNIILGQDIAHDPSTFYVSVIDFDNSMIMLPAFDVGYFLTQFKSQFSSRQDILKAYPENMFVESYGMKSSDHELLRLFKARAALSIAAFFIKVGKGETPELESFVEDAFTDIYKTT